MWQARMENNSADTDGRCSSGQDTRVYASYAREYGSKQRTTAVTGASVLCFWPRRGIRMNSWKEFLRRLVTAEFLPPEAISNYSTYRYTRDTPTSSSSRRKRKEKKKRGKKRRKNGKVDPFSSYFLTLKKDPRDPFIWREKQIVLSWFYNIKYDYNFKE